MVGMRGRNQIDMLCYISERERDGENWAREEAASIEYPFYTSLDLRKTSKY
jgi:hypothetical protein